MMGGTHRRGGMLVSVLGFAYLRHKGLLLPGVAEPLQWLVMYPFCMWGSVASDLDHAWESVPVRDYPSRVVHMALHMGAPLKRFLGLRMSESRKRKSLLYRLASLTTAVHRSWQTHSDMTLALIVWAVWWSVTGGGGRLGEVDRALLSLITVGLGFGVAAHLFLDMLTPDGIWCLPLVIIGKLFRLGRWFPRKLPHMPNIEFFKTGGKWELFVRKFLGVATFCSIVWFLYVTVFSGIWP